MSVIPEPLRKRYEDRWRNNTIPARVIAISLSSQVEVLEHASKRSETYMSTWSNCTVVDETPHVCAKPLTADSPLHESLSFVLQGILSAAHATNDVVSAYLLSQSRWV